MLSSIAKPARRFQHGYAQSRREPNWPTAAFPDAVYEAAAQEFGEAELARLTLAVVAINGWNRIAISFRVVPGSYQPAKSAH